MRNPIRLTFTLLSIARRIPAHLRWTFPAFILCAPFLLTAPVASAVVTTTQPPATHHHVHHPRRAQSKKPAAPAPPPQPPAPNWPVNDQPKPASVTWDSRGLSVVASNSSLAVILQQISTATGVHVEGFSADQRVFGAYGPGPAREILSEILSGSGYNVLILGGRGSSPPTRIVLSPRPTGPAPPAPPMQESGGDNGYPMDAAPQPPFDGNAPRFQPAPPLRTPQQIFEEMERRRQQMEQERQQQQQNQPQNPQQDDPQ